MKYVRDFETYMNDRDMPLLESEMEELIAEMELLDAIDEKELSDKQKATRKHFKDTLKDHGAKDLGDLNDDQTKKFFNALKTGPKKD